MRFLIYLRTIDGFGWYIRLIINSFWDMKAFLLILLIGVLAFASTFLSIEQVLQIEGKIRRRIVTDDDDFYELYLTDWVLAIQKSILAAVGDFGGVELDHYR